MNSKDLEEKAANVIRTKNTTRQARYHFAKSLGFPSTECLLLASRSEAVIIKIAKERGYKLPKELGL